MKIKIYYKHPEYGLFFRIKDKLVFKKHLVPAFMIGNYWFGFRSEDKGKRMIVKNKHPDFEKILKQSKRLFQKKSNVIK